MKRFSGFKSLGTQMMVYFAILILAALLFFAVFSIHYTEDAVLDNSKEYTGQIVEMVNSDIDSYIDYMINTAEITSNSDVLLFLYGGESAAVTAYDRLIEQFKLVLDTQEDIYNIAVLGDDGKFACNRGTATRNEYVDPYDQQWYQEAVAAGGTPVISAAHVQNLIANSYPWVVTLSKGIVNPATGEVEGVFFMDLNYAAIQQLCKKTYFGSNGYAFIIGKDGRLIYHPKQLLIMAGLKEEYVQEVLTNTSGSFQEGEGENKRIYSVSRSDRTGWTVVGVSDASELTKKRAEMLRTYIVATALLLAAALGIAILVSHKLTRPILRLERSMKEVQQGHFEHVDIEPQGYNEIASLGNSFNVMTSEIRHLMEENVKEQRLKRKSELMALQSQINPHFLYNTLDSIIWMAEGGKNEEVVLMTSALAKLLRQSIGNEDEIVSVKKEIDYTNSYLTIQKMRYRDQLEYEIDVPPRIQEMKIIKLSIQPLVENAIYHGIKYLEGKGKIWIIGYVENDKVVISIKDNGVGMEKEVLDHIFDGRPEEDQRGKVGVYNVYTRMQLYYGKEYGLQYESAPGEGTTAKLILPYIFKNDRQEEMENEE